MNSPAYLMSPNGAFAMYLSESGDLALYAVASNGALESEPYWSRGNKGVWVEGFTSTEGVYTPTQYTEVYETSYDLT